MATGIWAYRESEPIKSKASKEKAERLREEREKAGSVSRRVVSGFGIRGERGQALRSAKLDLNLAPARVVNVIAWFVSEDILVAQLHADFGCNVRQII